ncbi:patatin-like phospholipase family protein [Tessaracoccus coleopterorum]|uniref:patatin-like phospholipase family protein n=1 Tax=Tessaracoccus coleopterorum TaxID=2714950 RepID=UPI002F90D1B3
MREPITSNVTDTALIFEGGGMRGSFSSGVLVTLLEAGIHADWVGGISAGTTCVANYVSRDPLRAERSFIDLAAEPEFGDWRTWLQGKGVFNSEWIYEQTSEPHQVLPFDYATFSANPAEVRVGAFRCDDGEMVYWSRDDIDTPLDLMRRVRASSTMPALMPLTTIDDVVYCDGALGPTGGFAHDAAKADGYDRFLVVMTRERGYRKQPPKLPKAYRHVFRRYPEIARALVDRPANYNRSLEELLQAEREGRAFLIFPDEMPIANSERNLTRLRATFEAGRRQSQRQLPRLLDFLGLD